ncbi:FGGY family carbohydrate kinase [candidate division KSB1 bacterium]
MDYLVLTIDIGATSSRGIIRSQQEGGILLPDILSCKRVKTVTDLNEYGLLQDNSEEVLRHVLDLPRDLTSRIKVIVFVSHGASQLLLDSRGVPLFGTCSYDSPVFDETHDEFLQCFGGANTLYLETGSPDFPRGINSLQQIYWLKKNHPQRFARASVLLPLSSYLALLLTGNTFTDRTHTRNHAYIERIVSDGFQYGSAVKELGIESLFPPARRSFEPYGQVTPEVAAHYGLPDDCLVVAAGHDTSVIAALADNLASTGTWICNVARNRTIALEPFMRHKGLLVNADIHGANLRTTIARLGQMREVYLRRYREQRGRDLPNDLPFDRLRIGTGPVVLPAFTDNTGPYPSLRDETAAVPAGLLEDPKTFLHELAFSLAVQEVLSSIFAGDPAVSMENETLSGLIGRDYRAPDLAMGGPFAGNFVEPDGSDSGRLNLFLEYFRRLYPGRVSRFTFEEPTSFAAHWMGVAAREGVSPERIDRRVDIPSEDITCDRDLAALIQHLNKWEAAVGSID